MGRGQGGHWGEQTLSTISQPSCCKPSCKELALHCISSGLQQLLILFRDSCSFLGGIWTIFLSGDTQLLIYDPPQQWDDTSGIATITHRCATSPAFSGSHHRPPQPTLEEASPAWALQGKHHPTGSCGLSAHPRHRVPSAQWAQHSRGKN